MRRILTTAAVTVTAALLLTGCVDDGDPTANTSPAPEPTPTFIADTAAPADIAAAQTAAVAAMTDYLARDRTPQDWWATLLPHLSPEAAYTIEGTNPSRIAASRIAGEATATASSATRATVTVPTDAGAYTLVMTKRGDDDVSAAPWVVYSLTPPARS